MMIVGSAWRTLSLVALSAWTIVLYFTSHNVVSTRWTQYRSHHESDSEASNPIRPYSTSRFDGNSDILAYQKPAQKIVGFILAGRRDFVSILDCYLQRNLVRNGGWLDEVIWIIRTEIPLDLQYLANLVASVPEYRSHMTHKEDGSNLYMNVYTICEKNTIYIKMDDDVVFFEDHTIPAIVKRKLENPQFSIVSANVMNQPALSWVHYHLNTAKAFLPELAKPVDFNEDDSSREAQVSTNWRPSTLPPWTGPRGVRFDEMQPAPFKGHRWLPLPETVNIESTPIGILGEGAHHEYVANSSGWHSWAIAAQEHYSFLTHLENNELHRYKFDLWHYHFDRLSINFIAFSGDDIHQYGPVRGSDEQWLTVGMPKKSRRPAVLDGTAMAVHFGFHRQVYGHGGIPGRALNDTDLLARYRGFAKEFICGKKMGSPRL